jgi:hypothetical protein
MIINDSTPIPRGPGGLNLPFNNSYEGVADSFPSNLLIDSSEWQARIEEVEATETRISDFCLQYDLPCKDQERTNYCWMNAPTHAHEILRLLENAELITFSPASCAAQIKNYRNQGGWGLEAVEFIIKNGQVPTNLWPANAIDPKYATRENLEIAKNYRIQKWIELQPRNIPQLISLLLRRIPVAVGYSWWGHEVLACDPVWLDGTIAMRFRNSWGMGWGEKGFGILQGTRMLPDDAVAPLTSTI